MEFRSQPIFSTRVEYQLLSQSSTRDRNPVARLTTLLGNDNSCAMNRPKGPVTSKACVLSPLIPTLAACISNESLQRISDGLFTDVCFTAPNLAVIKVCLVGDLGRSAVSLNLLPAETDTDLLSL